MAESLVRGEIYALHDGGDQNVRLVIAYYEKYLEACKTRGISTGTASAEARLDQTKRVQNGDNPGTINETMALEEL